MNLVIVRHAIGPIHNLYYKVGGGGGGGGRGWLSDVCMHRAF